MNLLSFLYRTLPGRLLLKPLVSRRISDLAGAFLDTRASRFLIPLFIRRCRLDLSDYEDRSYTSFNDFFCRRVRPGKRPVDPAPSHLIAPCDGWFSWYSIHQDLVLPIKQSRFRISHLLGSRKLASCYDGGICLVFRLCVDHYHRYCFVDSGTPIGSRFIPGKLHTVRPIALENVPVYTENCREITLIRTDSFGPVIQVEIGAMLVGRICNHKITGLVKRGEEKGYFQYGGSTVLVLLKKDAAELLPEFLPEDGSEHPVRQGQRIGTRKQRIRLR